MAYPKIIWNGITLPFSFPPIDKTGPDDGAGDELQPVRSDSYTLSGLRQATFIRIDVYRKLTMELVPFADLAAWRDFMLYAQQGNPFNYYPDADLAAFDIMELDENQGGRSSRSQQGWAPDYSAGKGNDRWAKFDLNMRKIG